MHDYSFENIEYSIHLFLGFFRHFARGCTGSLGVDGHCAALVLFIWYLISPRKEGMQTLFPRRTLCRYPMAVWPVTTRSANTEPLIALLLLKRRNRPCQTRSRVLFSVSEFIEHILETPDHVDNVVKQSL